MVTNTRPNSPRTVPIAATTVVDSSPVFGNSPSLGVSGVGGVTGGVGGVTGGVGGVTGGVGGVTGGIGGVTGGVGGVTGGVGGVTGGVGGVTGGVGGVTGGVGGVTGGVGGVTGGVGGVTGGVGGVTLLLNSVSSGICVVKVNTFPSLVTVTFTVATIPSYSIPVSVPFTSST